MRRLLASLMFLGCLPVFAQNTPVFVQAQTTPTGNGVSTVSYSANVTAGDALYAISYDGSASGAVLTFSDSQSNVWTTSRSGSLNTDGDTIAIGCAIAKTTGSDTVTFLANGNPASVLGVVYEVKNSTCVEDVPAVSSDTGSQTSCNSGSLTTTTANDLLVGMCGLANEQTSLSAGSGWSSGETFGDTQGISGLAELEIAATPGSYAATSAAYSNTGEQGSLLVAFEPSQAAQNPPVVQAQTSPVGSGVTTLSYSANVTAGDALYAITYDPSGSGATLTFSDSQSNAWTTSKSGSLANDGDTVAIGCAIAQTTGPDTITFLVDGSPAWIVGNIYEVKNASCTQDVAAVSSDSTAQTSCSSGSLTTNTPNDLLVGMCGLANEQASLSVGSGWSYGENFADAQGSFGLTELAMATTPGSYAATSATFNQSSEQGSLLVAFRPMLPVPGLTLSNTPSTTAFGQTVTFTATISNGVTGTVTFYDNGTSIGSSSISGSTATFATSALTAGSHSIYASWPGNSNYNPATSSSVTQTVNPISPSITWSNPAPITYGISLSATQLNATANVPGTFAYSPVLGTVLTPGSYSLSVTFTPNDLVDYTATTDTVNLAVQGMPGPGIITTFAGNGSYGSTGDGGLAVDAGLEQPQGLFVDGSGNLYIADPAGNVVRKVSSSTGIISTIAGTGTQGYSGDGGPATSAQLNSPIAVTLDGAGNVYITDNNRIRKVNGSTGIITTVVGTGAAGYSGDGGPATSATVNPGGVAFDSSGNLIVVDTGNNVVRQVSASTGIITTIAGMGFNGYTGDGGPATQAELDNPISVAFDSGGNLYIADLKNNVIRKVSASTGIISTVVGNGIAGFQGDGGPAASSELNGPVVVVTDAADNLYISDCYNNVIRAVSASTGVISTIAGDGTAGYAGDGGPATSAELYNPHGFAFDSAGGFYIGDWENHRVRVVGLVSLSQVSVSVNPATANLYATQSAQFSATVTGTSNTSVTWSISPAGVGSVSAAGLYTAPSTISTQQTVTVTGTSQADPTKSASAIVTLLPPIAVTISPTTATLSATQQQQFSATVANSFNTAVAWSLSPAGSGTIDSSGNYTAPATIGTQQTVTVTATSKVDATKSASAVVTLAPTQCLTNGYSFVRTITIDHTKVPNSDQVNFPFLLSTTEPEFRSTANGGHVTNGNGDDIIFTSDLAGNNVLPFEQESYNASTGGVIYWVKIPELSHTTDTVIYMWYGNSNITASQQNPSGVWDSNYVGVWHLPNGTTLSANDSTANANNGTISSATATAGKIDGAAAFNGSSAINLGSSITTGEMNTVELWAYIQNLGSAQALVSHSGSGSGIEVLIFSNSVCAYVMGSSQSFLCSTDGVALSAWNHIVLTQGGPSSTMTLYINGVAVGTTSTPTSISNPPNLEFGVWANASGRYFNGSLDEVRISSAARSADWIAAEYSNQTSPSFYALSSENVTITPTAVSLFPQQTQQFIAAGPRSCDSAVTWSMPAGAPGTLSANGLYTAPTSITSVQTVVITATSQSDSAFTQNATVTLLPPFANAKLTLSASVQPPYVVGASEEFSATFTNSDGTPLANAQVAFSVTGANTGSGTGTTDVNGIATFSYSGAATGTDTIQASVNAASGQAVSNKVLASWIVPSQPLSTTSVLGQFFPFAPGTCCTFNATPAMTPAFAQVFPTINFNPPQGAIPNNTTVGVGTSPFTDVTVDQNGNFSGAIVAQGNGYQAWVGPLRAFQVVFTGSFIVESGGDVVIPMYVDNGFTLGIGGGATRVSGPSGGPEVTAFENYPVMGSFYTSIGGTSMTVHFPGPGTYPYEVDFVEDGSGYTSLMVMAGNTGGSGYAPGVPSGGILTLSPSSVQPQPVGGTEQFTVVATDASGNPVSNLSVGLVVSLGDEYDLSQTTNNAGTATFSYVNKSGPGTDQVQAVAIIDGVITYSNQVSVPWTQAPSTATGSGGTGTLNISIDAANTVVLPNSLQLSGSVTDSGLQSGQTISTTWSKASGTGTVTFANPNQVATTASFSGPGVYVLQLNATDPDEGGSAQIAVTVDPEPSSAQGWIGSPLNGATVSGIVPITVASGETLQSGTLTYYPANNPQSVTVLNGSTTGSGQIGTLDTTTLANGQYWITLQATDSNGNSSYNLALVTVVGNYKPGRVTSTVTDLVVPAKGLAIQIQRTYDTLNANSNGDFGYGWNLSTSVNLVANPFGSVTFTLGGQRRTFYLTPQPNGFLPYYIPVWTPEPGMHGTLVDAGSGCADFFDFLIADGPSWECVGGGPFTPAGYVYTDPSGTAYTMTASGQLQSIVDKNGNELTITANGITSSTGLSVPFLRDSKGRITQITDPQGNQYLYDYDASGNLSTVTYPNTSTPSTYTYVTGTHYYQSGTDFRGNPLPNTTYYGPTDTDSNGNPLNGRLETVTDALGEQTSYAYNLTTNTTTITYPADANGNVGTASMIYDSMGDVLSSTDPLGHTTTNTYDASQNLLSSNDPLNHTTTYTYDSNGNKTSTTYPATATSTNTTSTTAYNQYSQPAQTVDELGNIRAFNYDLNFNPQNVSDASGTLASFVFNTDGTMQSGAIGFDISANPAYASQFTYDANGNLASRTDALGRSTSYTYNSLGQKVTMIEPLLPGTSASAATTTYSYDPFGNLTQTAAPLGRTTKSTFDANGNKLSDTDADGNVTNYTYDALNRVTQTNYPNSTVSKKTYDFRGNVVNETDQAGNVTHHVYDLAGRQTSVTLAYGSSNATTTNYSYDNAGRVTSKTDALSHTTTYTYDAAGNQTGIAGPDGNFTYAYDNARNRVSMTDGNGNTTQYGYDARKRLVTTAYADGTSKTNAYDGPGNLVLVTDQNGNQIQYTYDAANQLKSVVQSNSPNTPNNLTSYSYDPLGNLIGLNDANSHLTESNFDLLSQQKSKTLPDGTLTEARQYDAAGNLTSLTHFNGKTTTYTYDSLNRLLSRTPDPTTGEPTVSFTYTPTGKRATMSDGSGTTNYSYDSMDRLMTKATPEGTLNYTYDAAGHLASMISTHTNGVSVSYTYDNLNRLSTVVDARLAGNQTTTYHYDTASNVSQVTYPNGVQFGFNYDQLNRLKQIATAQTGYLYTFDSAGNRKTGTELSGRASNWTYDGIYRLTNETISLDPNNKNGIVGYGLDPVGNRLTETSSLSGVNSGSFTFNADDELASETYDLDGNVTASNGKTFSYDTENHLVSMNSGAVQIVYDGQGNRVKKIVSGLTTQYLVDDLNPTGYAQVVEELQGGAVTRQYTYGLQLISQNQVISNSWTPSFYGYDGFGTVRQLTSSSGSITDTYDYDVFGDEVHSTGSTPNNYLYRGEELDSDLVLYYLRARYYNPLTGRFLSRDPNNGDLSNPVTLHKYLYANGDPVNGADPSGRDDTMENPRLFTIAVVATTGVIALRAAINCTYGWEGTRTSATAYAGPFGQVTQTGACTWEGTPPTVYPLPYPFPISTPAPVGGPGSCPPEEQWHHIVPQEFRPWANKCDIPIDSPGLGMCIPGKCHQRIHGGSSGAEWNTEWYHQIYVGWGGQCPSNQALIRFAQSLAVEFADDILCQ